MGYGFRVEVWGDYACFSRPELKVERVSYDVITPSAARGILEAVFWKPAIRYVVDEIAVCAPIRFDNIRRNEVSSVAIPSKPYIAATDDRAQRAATVLRGVRYVITAHFEPTDKLGDGDKLPGGAFNHGKFADEIRRRLTRGQNYHTPYLGTREFPANIRLVSDENPAPSPIAETRDFGLMLYDIDFVKQPLKDKKGRALFDESGRAAEEVTEFHPTYFMAKMVGGVLDLRNVEVLR
jgi:CRISPR-associated protein Cas5d